MPNRITDRSPAFPAPPTELPAPALSPAEPHADRPRQIDCSAAADEHGPAVGRRKARTARSVDRSEGRLDHHGDP